MSFYEDHVLPHLIGAACGVKPITYQRRLIVPQAEGRVLEVGLGAGPNLAFYDPSKVELVFGLEPSSGMRRKARKALAASPVKVELIDLPGENVPLDDASIDTVVLTYTLCTIPDWRQALAEMRRVLKPGGRLLFSEHGLAPDAGVSKWQRRIEPVWKAIAGGCHLTRPMDRMIAEGAFTFARIETGYLPHSPKFAGFNYWGSARPR